VNRWLGLLLPGIVLAMTSCTSGGAPHGPGTVVHVTERDFSIRMPRHVAAGEVVFVVRNDGPDAHELIITRTRGPLPTRSDGLTVDEEGLEPVTLGALEPGAPGGVRELRLHLTPGRYEVFCNMAGHYMGGMSAVLSVS
jgi:uncharacterized cupredoxin-like copper-binding protein